jgi:uncharacterized protein
MFLPDINVWLALIFEAHVHHRSVISWLNSNEDGTYFFCRISQQGFLRLSTNPAAFGEKALSMKKTWEIYDKIITDPRVSYLNDPDGLEQIWRNYTSKHSYSVKIWNDAYLAAFARCSGLTLVTLDKGFHQYKDMNYIILKA